jgi:Zn-dependent protease/CBS domain-containing protein
MGQSLKLFTVRGIEIKLHVTFPLILLWAGLQFGLMAGSLSGAMFGVVAISLLFVLVTLHELGHSFAAQRYGIHVKQIILSPLGGLAQLGEIPEKPVQELAIAVAGPAVNFAIAVLMAAAAWALGIGITNPLLVLTGTAGFTLTALFGYVFIYNIFLAVFNLLPAFPMDGGRILRALLAMRLEYARATRIAATIGRGLAIVMGLYGLFMGTIFLVLIALFIYMGAGQEAALVTLRSRLRGIRAQQVYQPNVHRLTADSTLQQAANMMIFTSQKDFPVVDDGALVGFLPQEDLVAALKASVPHAPVSRFMRTDVQPVSVHDDLFDVQQRLLREGIGALAVVSDRQLLGLITARHIHEVDRLLAAVPNALPRSRSAEAHQ